MSAREELLLRIADQNKLISEALTLNQKLTTYLERRRNYITMRTQSNDERMREGCFQPGFVDPDERHAAPDSPQSGYYSPTTTASHIGNSGGSLGSQVDHRLFVDTAVYKRGTGGGDKMLDSSWTRVKCPFCQKQITICLSC